ncbi:hypothetical protein [Microbispora sp. KK1-11]|uniref:hypothetical protein n=1 Tax=Microbispora sp. KK1-11 TaxID=2053005 RepID=UPI00115A665A|nr:hypothetical protein [Microbispora sp. KK1-11]TQS30073.1 hypothetical protein FLW16_06845 [Microbispora sp. KK1-11]
MITDAHHEQAATELAKFTPAQQAGLLRGIVAAFYAYENDPRLLDFAYETTALIDLGKLGA